MTRATVDHLFAQHLAQTHVTRANDLPLDRKRVQGFTAIVGGPNVRARNQTGLDINIDFSDVSRE